MKNLHILALAALILSFSACANTSAEAPVEKNAAPINVVAKKPVNVEGLSKAYFASGCFWCVEAIYESVNGVKEAVSGYAGGTKVNPTYKEVGSGRTGHAETVEVYYDPEVVDFKTLVVIFFGSHDPTTPNRQGPDYGTAYRSIAFYQNAEEKKIIEDYIAELVANGTYKEGEIVTEVKELKAFYEAEEYHQDFERRNPNQSYVRAVSIPRLNRFKNKFPDLLKENH
ncbi:MAG: peptide-methionine (S)-S-oxide reductase MsrA [Bacteroidota bacterium]